MAVLKLEGLHRRHQKAEELEFTTNLLASEQFHTAMELFLDALSALIAETTFKDGS